MATEETEIDNDLPDEIMSSLQGFYQSLHTAEEGLDPLLSRSTEDVIEKLDVLDRAKLDLMTVYAMNTMFWIYLISQGINPKEHGIKHELDRIKNYMGKIKEVTEKKNALLKIDKGAAKRFVKSALWKISDFLGGYQIFIHSILLDTAEKFKLEALTEKKDSNGKESNATETDTTKNEKRKKKSSSGKQKKHKTD